MLLGLAALKLFFLDVCLWGSWTGGNIFLIVFAALPNGFAIAQLLPTNDTTLIVMLVGISSGIGLLGNIWLAGIFMMLFFPMNLWLDNRSATVLKKIRQPMKAGRVADDRD